MMGPRSPIIKSGPQAISCGQREVPAAMARLAKVIVPNRVPTLPSRYRNGGYGSGLLVVPDEPDGDPQLSHWHRCIPVGQSIDDRSRLDRAMPRARSRSVNLLCAGWQIIFSQNAIIFSQVTFLLHLAAF